MRRWRATKSGGTDAHQSLAIHPTAQIGQFTDLRDGDVPRPALLKHLPEDGMIVVTGDACAKPETFDEVRRLSLEHVHRSRTESGCITHAVHIDCDNPLRFVFVERWTDKKALLAHFQVSASREFVKVLRGLLSEPSTIQIYDAAQLQMP